VEYVLTLFAATVGLSLTGSGAFSIDRLLARRELASEPATRPVAQPVEVR
jgi:hypothetical protein